MCPYTKFRICVSDFFFRGIGHRRTPWILGTSVNHSKPVSRVDWREPFQPVQPFVADSRLHRPNHLSQSPKQGASFR